MDPPLPSAVQSWPPVPSPGGPLPTHPTPPLLLATPRAACSLESEVQPGPGTHLSGAPSSGCQAERPWTAPWTLPIHFAVAGHLGCLRARWIGMKLP